MKILLCILIGYLLGSLNPAALISKIKHKNIRKSGTGNLGATNVMLNFGKRFGVLVMIFDIAKAFAAVKLAGLLFPHSSVLPLLAGASSVIGHIFPFYLKFKGGKGLAAYAGMVLAYDPLIFLILLIIGFALVLLVNYSFALPYSASLLLPVFAGIRHSSIVSALICMAVGILLMVKHAENIDKAAKGTDVKVREYIKRTFSSNTNK